MMCFYAPKLFRELLAGQADGSLPALLKKVSAACGLKVDGEAEPLDCSDGRANTSGVSSGFVKAWREGCALSS